MPHKGEDMSEQKQQAEAADGQSHLTDELGVTDAMCPTDYSDVLGYPLQCAEFFGNRRSGLVLHLRHHLARCFESPNPRLWS